MGGYLNGLIFLMFLLAVGYNNNLLLIFTLFLFGFNLLWVIQTHYHLHELKIDYLTIEDNHAELPQAVKIFWKKTPTGPWNWKIVIESGDDHYSLNVMETNREYSLGELILPSRGHRRFNYLRVSTSLPFGLYHSWVYFKINAESWSWPVRLRDLPFIENFSYAGDGNQVSLRRGPHDVWGQGPYQGESSRFINWKYYARSGELVIKEGEEKNQKLVHLRFYQGIPDKEYMLSKLATHMVSCGLSATSFTFDSGNKKLGPGHDQKFLAECLRELTLC
jgi:hypothetical protein